MTDFIIIPKPDIMARILDRIPEFADRWRAHLEYWEGEEAGIYNDLAEFSHFIVDSYFDGEEEVVVSAFELFEEILRRMTIA